MIRIRRLPLGAAERAGLAAYQRTLAGCPPKDKKITRQWNRFIRDKALKPQVFAVLQQQSDCKCVYCENEDASTMDHFYPKSEYPGRAFRWENLNLSCSPCNNAKRTVFPLSGRRPVILNPMAEEIADFFTIDPTTGVITPAAGLTPFRRRRAKETIDNFKLTREGLNRARRKVARRVRKALEGYATVPGPATQAILLELLSSDEPFRAVVRQLLKYPEPGLAAAVQTALANPAISAYVSSRNLI